MSQRLEKIHIEGYKSIKKMDLELKNINILIGANGSGKSNFVSIFKFLRQIVQQHLQVTILQSGGDIDNFFYYGIKETELINIQLDFSSNKYRLCLIPSGSSALFIRNEDISIHYESDKEPSWENITLNASESRLENVAKKGGDSKYVYDALKSWRVYHFHDTGETALVKRSGAINDNLFLREDGSNLAASLYRMKIENIKYYERIVETIRLVVPMFNDFLLVPNLKNEERIRLEWFAKTSDMPFAAEQLSDGSLRFICLCVALLQPERPIIILLDEPELGLHPTAVKILAGLIRKASNFSQLIISTQSRELIDEFQAENIVVVENEEGHSTFNRLHNQELAYWTEKYSMAEIWDRNVIGGRP